MSGLTFIGQDDFGVGVLRGVAPDTQPGVGLYNAVNGLFNDDGDVYRRGADTFLGDSFGAPLTFSWNGYLAGRQQALIASADDTWAGFPDAPIGPGVAGPVLPAVVRDTLYLPNLQSWTGGATGLDPLVAWTLPSSLPADQTVHVCAAAGRLLVAAGNRIAFSTAPPDAFAFNPTDYHELPGGVVVVGMTAIRDTVFVFTSYGLWTIANLAFDLTDAQGNPQQTLQLITPEITLWHESGLSEWQGRIVAPCIDRVYLIDGINPPVAISDSITPYYTYWVREGYRPGGVKVFHNHLFLPITDAENLPFTQLVCRLDRPTRARHVYYPWSFLTGHAGYAVAYDVANAPGVSQLTFVGSDSHVSDFSAVLTPIPEYPVDADGDSFEFDVETRDFPTGSGQPNHVRQIRLRYTLDGVAAVTAYYSFSSRSTLEPDDVDRDWVDLGAQDLIDPGLDPLRWRLPGARRVRFARMRFRCTDAPGHLVFHHVDMAVRSAAHNR